MLLGLTTCLVLFPVVALCLPDQGLLIPEPCDLSVVNFGPCKAILGWGIISDTCERIGGCQSPVELFDSEDACKNKCSPANNNKSHSRRKLLMTAVTLEPSDDAFAAYLDACGALDYGVELYIDASSHLYAIGYPKEAAVAVGCPMVATHAVWMGTKDTTVHKEILVWEDWEQGLSMFEEDGRLSMGTLKLTAMARAFEDAEPDAGSGGGLYDIVTNNCGSYLVNLASKVDLKIDTRVTSFVVHRLLENSGEMLALRIRNSFSNLSLFQDRNLRATRVTDKELVELLVFKGASTLE